MKQLKLLLLAGFAALALLTSAAAEELKIAVVDDSSADRECLSSYISRFAFEHNYEIDVSLHCLGENFLEDADF
ncbi:MAG: hypothetical protein RR060_00950, partial [Victivallaceae bacterium]